MPTKEEIYARTGMGQAVGFGRRPAIVVIDFQKGFTQEDVLGTGQNMALECAATRRLTDAAREKNIRVFYTRVGYKPDGVDGGIFSKKCPNLLEHMEGSWQYEWDEALDVRPEDVALEKHWPSAFFGTPIAPILTALHVDTVILCGCTVGGCVYASALDSMSHGFRTIIPRDAVADRSREVYDMFLFNMGYKYADISSVDDCIGQFGKIAPLEYW